MCGIELVRIRSSTNYGTHACIDCGRVLEASQVHKFWKMKEQAEAKVDGPETN